VDNILRHEGAHLRRAAQRDGDHGADEHPSSAALGFIRKIGHTESIGGGQWKHSKVSLQEINGLNGWDILAFAQLTTAKRTPESSGSAAWR